MGKMNETKMSMIAEDPADESEMKMPARPTGTDKIPKIPENRSAPEYVARAEEIPHDTSSSVQEDTQDRTAPPNVDLEADGGQTIGSGPRSITIPGAYAVRGSVSEEQEDSPSVGSDEEDDEAAGYLIQADSCNLATSGHVAATAYAVDEDAEPSYAKVVKTVLGIDRKRLMGLAAGVFVLLVIILTTVLGILLPKMKNMSTEPHVCGPICGEDNGGPPDPKRVIMGFACQDWDFNSTFLPVAPGECPSDYSAAAYGCGCPRVEMPSDPCGLLCSDGSELPNPELLVRSVDNIELTCADWELKSKFDSDENECVNYNVMGILCGCQNNEPHPDACGPLCEHGYSPLLQPHARCVGGNSCEDWNVISSNLPIWYFNEEGQTCSEYYHDIQYACSCPEITTPPDTCGTICKDRRRCAPICQDGSKVPDPEFITRDTSCQAWEFHSRMEFYEETCPFYDMVGAECGCDNTPPEGACGPLCGAGTSIPDPDMEVQGLTCKEWNSMSTYLSEGYGVKSGDYASEMFNSCDEFFSKIAYACGCPGFEPPVNGCGLLCEDGSSPPDPSLIVGDRSCEDWELLSMFETIPFECTRFSMIGSQCGCKGTHSSNNTECFNLESLMGQTFDHTVGTSHYMITFGEGGLFAEMQNDFATAIIGIYHGFGTDSKANVTSFGDGKPCGKYGPRRGSVVVVEDASVAEPAISYVIQPTMCYYRAELRVPTYCNSTIMQ